MADHCAVLTTCGSRADADHLAGRLVEARLAACVQLVEITSCYVWAGEVAREPEVLLIAKTREDLYDAVQAAILEIHGYDVPEVVRVPIGGGLPAYLGWIDEVTEAAARRG